MVSKMRAVTVLVWIVFGLLFSRAAIADGMSNQPPVKIAVRIAIADAKIAAVIVSACSIYPDACTCPHHIAGNGSSCGQRSARTRRGGWKPICYLFDITPRMIEIYRKTGDTAKACKFIEQDRKRSNQRARVLAAHLGIETEQRPCQNPISRQKWVDGALKLTCCIAPIIT
jgi:hypothetical protein